MKAVGLLALLALLALAGPGPAMGQSAAVCGCNGKATFTSPIGVIPQTTDGFCFSATLGDPGQVAPLIPCTGTQPAQKASQGATVSVCRVLEPGATCAAFTFTAPSFTVTLSDGAVCNGGSITGAAAGGVVSGTPATFTCNGGAANGTWETTFVLEFPTENGSGPATECAANNNLSALFFTGVCVWAQS